MSPITEFYSGRTVFVTGATGFMGKVLLEKLVRSLPDLKKIYILVRPKKQFTVEERIKKLAGGLIFTFNNVGQLALNKIEAISGDISKENFEMSELDRQKVIDEVSIVFHLAASIRMDLPLKEAVMVNTKSTHQLFKFCMNIKNLVSVVHLSTAYCNVEISHVEEKVYPLSVDPYKVIDLVDWMNDTSLSTIENDIISPHPNTYTYTKRLSEIIAMDMGDKLPLIIVRPSIVLPAMFEPIPGWVDSYNGPVGLFLAGGKGVLRTSLLNPDLAPQAVPVDIAINGLIISGYERAAHAYSHTPVFSSTESQNYEMTWRNCFTFFMNLTLKYPFKKTIWCPIVNYTQNYYLYLFYAVLFHFIPALIVDFILIMILQQPFLFSIQRRAYLATKLLRHFTLTKWEFSNFKTLQITQKLSVDDNKIFYTNLKGDLEKYFTDMFFFARNYLAKESVENLGIYRLQQKVYYVLDKLFKLVFCYVVLKIFWKWVQTLF